MGTTQIEEIIRNTISQGADSAVLYRLPFYSRKSMILGKAERLDTIDENKLQDKGFIIYPFNRQKHEAVWLSQEYNRQYDGELPVGASRVLQMLFGRNRLEEEEYETPKSEYMRQFRQMHQAILSGEVQKVILSRIKTVPGIGDDGVLSVYDELCTLYPHAFVYALVSPVTGVWIGAGPELLLQKKGRAFSSVSLAGTLPNTANFEWSAKEEVEQALVTRYMKQVLSDCGVSDYQTKGPYTVEAGQVKHLNTDFAFELDEGDQVATVLNSLHPTPAVCGLPKGKAIGLIDRVEQHHRNLYAGYLGPVEEGDFSFFVNIRCLKLAPSSAALYLGGGLTKESEADKEWEETELKAQTLLAVLNKVSNLHGYE